MPSYKANIIRALNRLGTNGTANPDERSNSGRTLGQAYLWHVVRDIATDKEKEAWRTLTAEGLILDDESIRTNLHGESVLCSSPSFQVQARVDKPREQFDRDLFIEAVARKFKIDKHKLIELSATCKKYTKAPVTKRIIEID